MLKISQTKHASNNEVSNETVTERTIIINSMKRELNFLVRIIRREGFEILILKVRIEGKSNSKEYGSDCLTFTTINEERYHVTVQNSFSLFR